MGDIEDLKQFIESNLDKIEKEIGGLSKKDHATKKAAIKKIEAKFTQTSTTLESFDMEVAQLEGDDVGEYKQCFKDNSDRYNKLKNELEFKRNEGMQDLFENRVIQQNQNMDPNDMTATEMIQVGDDAHDQIDSALNNIEGTIEQTKDLGANILLNMDAQIEQLDKILNDAKDMESELKRTQKYLKYFAKNMATDKLVMCFIFLIVAAIVTLIVLTFMGYGDDKTSQPDQIDEQDTVEAVEQVSRRILIQQGKYFLNRIQNINNN